MFLFNITNKEKKEDKSKLNNIKFYIKKNEYEFINIFGMPYIYHHLLLIFILLYQI